MALVMVTVKLSKTTGHSNSKHSGNSNLDSKNKSNDNEERSQSQSCCNSCNDSSTAVTILVKLMDIVMAIANNSRY